MDNLRLKQSYKPRSSLCLSYRIILLDNNHNFYKINNIIKWANIIYNILLLFTYLILRFHIFSSPFSQTRYYIQYCNNCVTGKIKNPQFRMVFFFFIINCPVCILSTYKRHLT